MYPDAKQKPSKERLSIAEQARAILQGKKVWKPTLDTWVNVGEEVEVEKDVKVPRLRPESQRKSEGNDLGVEHRKSVYIEAGIDCMSISLNGDKCTQRIKKTLFVHQPKHTITHVNISFDIRY